MTANTETQQTKPAASINPIRVHCTHCGSPPGRRCTTGGYGNRVTGQPHRARIQTAQEKADA